MLYGSISIRILLVYLLWGFLLFGGCFRYVVTFGGGRVLIFFVCKFDTVVFSWGLGSCSKKCKGSSPGSAMVLYLLESWESVNQSLCSFGLKSLSFRDTLAYHREVRCSLITSTKEKSDSVFPGTFDLSISWKIDKDHAIRSVLCDFIRKVKWLKNVVMSTH